MMKLFNNTLFKEEVNISYSELLQSPQWLRKRKLILNRDLNKCKNCSSRKNLQVHHRQYRFNKALNEFVKPWEYPNKFLITLCDSCHKNGHKLYNVPVINIKNKQ